MFSYSSAHLTRGTLQRLGHLRVGSLHPTGTASPPTGTDDTDRHHTYHFGLCPARPGPETVVHRGLLVLTWNRHLLTALPPGSGTGIGVLS